ncbi:hypothetical protein O181_094662 [Austropuccinia psidii MF-1]|uniref:Reverse transcriptase Ty1/copia-type domain-containing protein n=1 Tax=Austropuccinia psidii MF-1 TaxID=1389203 RepID=A0A9Q3PBQ8_9BASI|nr:hypothetical protein [Austropuccinia psidii MF-1]
MLSLVVTFQLIPYQFDIETEFLHGDMDAVVYVKQVTGYEQKGRENWVWRLNKSLYGTKQAPRMWKSKFTEVLLSLDMRSAEADESLFISSNKTLMLHIHVDDGFLISKNEGLILNFLSNLNKKLKLKFKKCPTQHLGYNFVWEGDRLLINKSDLINKILDQFDMENSKAVKTPCNGNLLNEINFKGGSQDITQFQQAIGSLNYIAQHTRPDIMFTINQLSRFCTQPGSMYWSALKHLLRYLKGTCMLNLEYSKPAISSSTQCLAGWADADYANSKEDRKSILGHIVLVYGNPISWLSKKQSVVAQSTTEAEFISLNICAKQMRWVSFVLSDLGQEIVKPIMFSDNLGAVTISKQASSNANTKHIEVRYQYIRDCVVRNLLSINQVSSSEMIADILTKPLGAQQMTTVYKQLHLVDPAGVSNESGVEKHKAVKS